MVLNKQPAGVRLHRRWTVKPIEIFSLPGNFRDWLQSAAHWA